MNPTREDLIELGYLKPGDTLARAPKRERKLFLTESDLEYANRHGLTRQEMKDFKEDMMVEEEILFVIIVSWQLKINVSITIHLKHITSHGNQIIQ